MNGSRRNLGLEAYSESLYPQRLGWSPLRALRDGKFKLIDAPRPELYDVEDDPVEERNIYDSRRALAETMTARLAALARGVSSTSKGLGVNPEVQAQLASLGYLGGGARRESAGSGSLPDPKDCISSYARTPGSPVFNRSCGQWDPTDHADVAPRR
jgi:choline-sulfatase